MRLENTFEVPAPPEQAWELLNDVPRVVPCMPGAELTETVDENTWKATMHVKLGPIALQFGTDVTRKAQDEAARTTTLQASARELKGRGGATAMIESTLEPPRDRHAGDDRHRPDAAGRGRPVRPRRRRPTSRTSS